MSIQQKISPEMAIRSVVDRYGRELQDYLTRRLRDTQHARDLAQEVYLRLLRTGSDEPVRDYRAYMYRIAAHVVHEFKYRSDDVELAVDSEAVEDWAEHPGHVEADELAVEELSERVLEEAFARLTPRCQAVFLLEVRDGLSHEEVASRLEMSLFMVKKYMVQAVATLRSARWKA